MIKNIQRIKNFGIFDDYIRPPTIADFAEKNVIYGWNYSGKTTISRLFNALQTKSLSDDFHTAKFSVIDHGGMTITEASLGTCDKSLAVFNSDFVSKNLSWDGEAFLPILLLGDDSIEAEKRIAAYEVLIQRCRNGFATKRNAIAAVDNAVAEGKTLVAKQIKTTLNIVEAFNAIHLTQVLTFIGLDDKDHLMSAEQLSADLVLALTPEKDKLSAIQKVSLTAQLNDLRESATKLLAKTPSLSSTIEYLTTHPNVSEWVELGFHLHDNATNCEFCGNKLGEDRMLALRAHFSKDLLSHKKEVQALEQRIDAAKLEYSQKRDSEFNPQFRERLKPIAMNLMSAVSAYNGELDSMKLLCAAKLKSPFDPQTVNPGSVKTQAEVEGAANAINQLIAENNDISENFTAERKNANQRLRRNHAAQFLVDYKVAEGELKKSRWKTHQARYEKVAKQMQAEVRALQATINRAQKGREKINERIAGLLGSESIQISVVKVADEDRFQLTRQGIVAKNMSEGEKTAIAFAFFLIKLQEVKELHDVIVYIDDPISSLDSNHIFQVFSIIKTAFFRREAGKPDGEWTTTCKQIFLSTHNFEFFSLLRELPCKKSKSRYYLVKRVSPTRSTLMDLPDSILRYSSEYHYLFSVIYSFHKSPVKTDIELLLSLPNAVRRFLELYTYSKIPRANSTVDERAAVLFGAEKALRITKVLHHFSHLGSIERLAVNTDLISDIDNVVNEVVELVKMDTQHFNALEQAVI
ncbi:MAG TPA: AAA family ATPase [Rhodocyclaceae bacterium]|nr:AAA family ATPase [Rhodocyclaceae bacterium]